MGNSITNQSGLNTQNKVQTANQDKQTETGLPITSKPLLQNTDAQNDEAMKRLSDKAANKPSNELEKFAELKVPPQKLAEFYKLILNEQPISAKISDKPAISVELIINKSAGQATLEDYRRAFDLAVLQKAGYNLKGEELQMARDLMKFGDNWTLESRRAEDAKPGGMYEKVSPRSIEIAKRAGQAVLRYQKYISERNDLIDEYRKQYARTTFGGFVQPGYNGVVNVINGSTEPFRATERIAFGTSYLPEIPRIDVAKDSEYWRKDGRLVINYGAEIVSTMVIGGLLGARAIATQSGRVLVGIESAYNVGAGAIGKDVTKTEENGEFRQMPWGERGLRIAGGLLGARQTVKTEISTPNSITNTGADKAVSTYNSAKTKAAETLDEIFNNSPFKPQGELVTPEGIRIKVNIDEVSSIKRENILEMRSTETPPVGRRNLDSHEGVSGVQEGKQLGHTLLKHVGKSEKWLQDRIRREGVSSASSFYNESVGNRTIGKFKKLYEAEIEQWLKSNSEKPFKATIDMKEDVGLVVNTNKKGTPLGAERATKADVVLVKDNSEFGWHLFTVMLRH